MSETSDDEQVVPTIETDGESLINLPGLSKRENAQTEVDKGADRTADKAMSVIAAAESKEDPMRTYLDNLPKTNGCIDFSKLQKIGSGGTHDVYQLDGDSKYVIKINRGVLAKVKELGTPKTLAGKLSDQAEAYIKEKNVENEALYKRFGRDNCIKEKAVRAKVSLPTAEGSEETETVVSIQEKSDVFKIKDTVDFGTDYKGKIKGDLVGRIKSDILFRAKVAEFLTKFKEYFEQTGRFIDLVGEKNVLFLKDEKAQWHYMIGSVTKGDSRDKFEAAYENFTKNPKNLKEDEANNLKNGAAIINFANEAGKACGTGKIIETKVPDEELQRIMETLS